MSGAKWGEERPALPPYFRLRTNVPPASALRPIDRIDAGIGAGTRFVERRAEARDIQHTAAIGDQLLARRAWCRHG